MTFLNFALLGGVLAGVLPIVIHLLRRSRFRPLPWGAMHLLEQVLRVHRRRLELEQILLLILRALIPLTLALLMARPVLTANRTLAGRAPTSLTVALDDSLSMVADSGARPAFDRALAECERVVYHLPPGAEFSVLYLGKAGAPPRDTPTSDRLETIALLRATGPVHGPADPAAALEQYAALLPGQHHSDRELLIVSDFQRADWAVDDPALAEALARLRALPLPPRITLLQIPADHRDNVAVESVEPPALAPGPGQPARIHATIRNYGSGSFPHLRVHLLADGLLRATTEIALGPDQSARASFPHIFERPGTHPVEIRVDAGPPRGDNARAAIVAVRDRLPVVILDGDPRPEPLRSESAFLQIALQPGGGGTPALDWIELRVVQHPSQLSRALASARVAILANAQRLAGRELNDLARFVTDGGGLLIFPGDKIDADWYNSILHDRGEGPLPLRLASIEGSLDGRRPPTRVASQEFAHAALDIFRDPAGSRRPALGATEVLLWFKLVDDPASSPPAQILARFENGDPFLAEKRFGRGRVILCAIPADGDWSNLPMRPPYLPLVQRLVAYLASAADTTHNLQPGQPIVATFPVTRGAGPAITLTRPDGAPRQLAAQTGDRAASVEVADTRSPGIYTLSPEGAPPLHYAVAIPPRESDPATLAPGELRELARSLGASLALSSNEYFALDQTRRHGRELWRTLLFCLLAFALAETLLLRRLHRPTRTRGRQPAAPAPAPAR